MNALYLATPTHATTMLSGAVLACVVLERTPSTRGARFLVATRGRAWLLDVVALAAWATVLVAFLTVGGTGPFLYRGGYVLVGLVVAVALGTTVTRPAGPAARALALAPVAFVGRISYGIYLFHFPLFLWLDHGRTGLGGVWLLGVRLAATLAVATASYVLVERPIRERRLLRGVRGLVFGGIAYVASAILVWSLVASAATAPFADRDARAAFEFHPPTGTAATVLVVGDSMAQTLGDGLDGPLAARARTFFYVHGDPECSLVPGRFRLKDFRLTPPARCAAGGPRGWEERWSADVRADRPTVSMALFRLDVVDHRLDGRWERIGEPGFDCVLRAHLVVLAAVLASTGRPVVLLTTPYYDAGEQPDGAPWPEDAPWRVRRYDAMLRAVAARFPGVVHVVDLNAMADPRGRFARVVDGTVLRWVDGVHFTYAGDDYLLPRLLAALRPIEDGRPTPGALAALRAAARADVHEACTAG